MRRMNIERNLFWNNRTWSYYLCAGATHQTELHIVLFKEIRVNERGIGMGQLRFRAKTMN